MLLQIKSKIHYYFLKKQSIQKRRSGNMVVLSDAKKIGVLFDADTADSIKNVKILLKHLLDRSIDVDVLGFVNSRKKDQVHIATLHINYFNLSDLSLFGFPNSKKTTSFIRKKYDMLINLSLKNSFETNYLALLSDSQFKVGLYCNNSVFVYDLMLKLKIQSLEYFIKHVIHYLELIDNNHEKQ
tara:strand:+ start:4122 stop:4673 length:552 start_codon:yes stop_codon:yes gene_type:complete